MFSFLKRKPDPLDVQEFFKAATKEYSFTPDFWELHKRMQHRVFVYGREMETHPDHNKRMSASSIYATGYTDTKFMLWRKNLGLESYPIALTGENWERPLWARPKMARVQGEVFICPTKSLVELDKYYQNTLEFNRIRAKIIVPYRDLFKVSNSSLYPHSIKSHINEEHGVEEQVVAIRKKEKVITAWIYVGKSEYWDSFFTSHVRPFTYFTPVSGFTSRLNWLGDYYSFTLNDYK